jgi:glutaminyl-peptide cyclotransferase
MNLRRWGIGLLIGGTVMWVLRAGLGWWFRPFQDHLPIQSVTVVATYPHDPKAFTEGLAFQDGLLYESTGQNGQSFVRKVDLTTGQVRQEIALNPAYFGEGLVPWQDKLFQLTYTSHLGFIYDRRTLQQIGTFTYPGEGWALTSDGHRLWMSDGSHTLRILDPATLKQVGSLPVTAQGHPVFNLNELEWIHGELWANIFTSTRIARIDPATGQVKGWVDLAALAPDPKTLADPANDVANGIAYDAATDRIFVTGKDWPHLYEIRLNPPQPSQANGGK